MNITTFLDKQIRLESSHRSIDTAGIDEMVMRLESALNNFGKVRSILDAVTKHQLSTEELKLAQYSLSTIPTEFQDRGVRLENHSVTTNGLKLRAEGILGSIGDAISKFFKWIGDAFSRLFGGEGGGGGGGGSAATEAGVAAILAATGQVVQTAVSNGNDEFLFKTDNPLFNLLDLGDLDRCKKYYSAAIDSTKALVDIHEKSIKLSEKADKNYSGDYNKDVVTELGKFAASKSTGYAKENIDSTALNGSQYFAFPANFLTVRVLAFTDTEIFVPSKGAQNDFTGKGFTKKDVYINVQTWKQFVDLFGKYAGEIYAADKRIATLAEGYKKLEALSSGWADVSTEELKKLSEGVKQLNRVASYVLECVKAQDSTLSKISTALKNVVENDLRKQAEAGRKKEADDKAAEEKKKKDEADAAAAAANPAAAPPATPPATPPAAA